MRGMKFDMDREQGLVDFCTAIASRACADHKAHNPILTGEELMEEYGVNDRKGHKRLASSIYRKVRWTLELRDTGKSDL